MILNRENTIDSLKNNRIEERNGIKFQEFPFVNKTYSVTKIMTENGKLKYKVIGEDNYDYRKEKLNTPENKKINDYNKKKYINVLDYPMQCKGNIQRVKKY